MKSSGACPAAGGADRPISSGYIFRIQIVPFSPDGHIKLRRKDA